MKPSPQRVVARYVSEEHDQVEAMRSQLKTSLTSIKHVIQMLKRARHFPSLRNEITDLLRLQHKIEDALKINWDNKEIGVDDWV